MKIATMDGSGFVKLPFDDLRGKDLTGKNLSGLDLSNLDMRYANLWLSNLKGSSLRGTNLTGVNFADCDLTGTDLTGAIMEGTRFHRARLSGAILDPELAERFHDAPQGEIIGYKSTQEGIITLKIPAEARRSRATTEKHRAEFAIPIAMPNGLTECTSWHDEDFKYRLNEIARCHEWQENRWIECGGGIHFFLTREEAESHDLSERRWKKYRRNVMKILRTFE